MFVGYIYIKYGKILFSKLSFIKIKKVKPNVKNKISTVDLILDKLKLKGWDGLTDEEKTILYKASKEKQSHDSIN